MLVGEVVERMGVKDEAKERLSELFVSSRVKAEQRL